MKKIFIIFVNRKQVMESTFYKYKYTEKIFQIYFAELSKMFYVLFY